MLKRIWENEDGQAMVEYGLIIALIAIAVILTVTAVGTKLDALFGKVRDNLD